MSDQQAQKKTLAIRDKTIFDGIFVKYILKFIYAVWFKLAGWKSVNTVSEGAGITIAAPHTSNWDFIYALGAAILNDVKIYFSIKDSWCRIPVIGSVVMWLGAIPIDRSSKGRGQVDLIKAFVEKHKNDRVYFLFTPEGTRGAVTKWKTGFYHVAQDCGLPIFLAKVDFLKKESGVFHSYAITGNREEDIAAIQESYKSICGKNPDWQYPHYNGPMPELSPAEVLVIKTLYTLKGMATKAEITAKAKMDELSSEMLDFLVEKGILERGGNGTPSYTLTLAGKGFLLHMSPRLP